MRVAATQYPAIPTWTSYSALLARHAELVERHRQAGRDLDRLDRTRDAAVEADRSAYADALAAGDKDPGAKITEKHDKDAAAKRRELDALALAVHRVEGEITRLIDAEGDGQLEQLVSLAEADREASQLLVADLQAAYFRLRREQAVTAWLSRALEGEAISYRDRGAGVLPGMMRPSGDPYSAEDLLASLAQSLEPTTRTAREPGQHVPLADQTLGAGMDAWAERPQQHPALNVAGVPVYGLDDSGDGDDE